MKKKCHTKKQLVLWLLVTAVTFSQVRSQIPFAVHAQETEDIEASENTEGVEETEEAEISLAYVSNVTVDTEGSRLRIYGEENTTYNVPINITANCTVILDNVSDTADLTVADGVNAEILLRGTNALHNICAQGGSATQVCIRGESDGSTLTANNIACPDGGSAATGAEVLIENSTIICANLSCGGNGKDTAYKSGSATVASASPGSNASPCVTIRSADLTVNGNLACGGNGLQSTGTWSAATSHGGTSGEVIIDASRVTVSGNVSMGGKGGNGGMGSTYYSCTAGNTKSASPVTIRNHSTVTVSGNVSTQQDLPQVSNEGSQSGLHGVTVTVSDSVLTAKDIASGGNGHVQVHYDAYSGSGSSYNIYGTAGGNGGTLVADHADITCETVVCGGNAGDYMSYTVDIYGTKSGDYECVHHPLDGNGGEILSDNSKLTITSIGCEKGSRWNGYANASTHKNSTFLGGTLKGTVYGSIITTDMTSILEGGFMADTDIRNSEEASCAECVLQTDEDMCGQTVQVFANDLTGTAILDDTGNLHTYLSVGKQELRLNGAVIYAGSNMVKRSVPLNVFQLAPYGKICVDQSGAVITEHAYTYLGESYSYNGDYTITGNSENAEISVESGRHHLLLHDTFFGTLNVKGTSEVILQPDEHASIDTINVDSDAVLTVAGIGEIYADSGIFSVSECNGILQNEDGSRMFPVEMVFELPGTYHLKLNGEELTVETNEDGVVYFLLAEGNYDLQVACEPFYFYGNFPVVGKQQIEQTDLSLYADISKGDLVIEDHTVSLGDDRIQSNANVTVIQSTDEAHAVYVEKKDAMLIIDDPKADMQIYLPEGFEGQIENTSGTAVQLVTISTGYPDQELTLKLDGQEYVITTDSEGNFPFLATGGNHSLEITIDDTTYRSVHPFCISGSATGSYSIADDMTDDPDAATDTDTDAGTDTDQGTNTDPDTNADPDTNTDSGTDVDPGTNTDSGTDSGSGATSRVSGGGSSQPNVSSAGGSGQTSTSAAVASTIVSPSISMQASLKGISMLSAKAKNTYKLYTRKKISFKVTREADTDYYYKILRRGQQNSEGQWKKLNADKITVSSSSNSAKGQRIVLKAVNEAGSTVRKTTGFVIDTQKPAVEGVRNAGFYQKKRTICISDNCGSCEVRLNGKKMKQRFSIQKRGIYLLTASDPAGNQRTVLFAML